MRSEAPFILKALRLVSVVVIVAVVALAASAGYSAYQEYRVLSGTLSQNQQQQQGQQGNNRFLSESFNGTSLILSGINIPNNMTYPLGLQLSGIVLYDQTNICTFASTPETIPPGEARSLQLSANVNFTKVLSNSSALGKLFLEPALLSTNVTILASIAPLLVLDISQSSNTTIGPILGQFSVSLQTPSLSNNGQDWILPLNIAWNNSTPLKFQGTLGATITQIPGRSTGNYGSASTSINMTQGLNQDTLTFNVPTSQFSSSNPHGQFDFNITLSAFGSLVSIPESATI